MLVRCITRPRQCPVSFIIYVMRQMGIDGSDGGFVDLCEKWGLMETTEKIGLGFMQMIKIDGKVGFRNRRGVALGRGGG